MRTFLATAAWLAATAALAQDSNDGQEVATLVSCGGVDAVLFVNAPEYAAPTLEVNGAAVTLEEGPSYGGPVCVAWRGAPHVGFTEYMGNAYETYRLVDPATLEVTEVTAQEAEALGWYD